MPNETTDRRLDKLGLWALQTVFGIGLLVASWFLGGLYERIEKVDVRVNANITQTQLNEEKITNAVESNRRQWQKLSELEGKINRLEGALLRLENTRNN